MSSSNNRFTASYQAWKRWEAAGQSGDDERLKALDFTPVPMCTGCGKPSVDSLTGERKTMRCGGCQALVYCSRACQTTDWKSSSNKQIPPHKLLCARNKEHMKRTEYFQSQLTQFPWSRVEYDGSCPHDILRARFGVLGTGPKFGYWSTRSERPTKDTKEPELFLLPDDLPLPSTTSYAPGQVLLGKAWPKHEDAWLLKNPEHIPILTFSEESEDDGKRRPPPVLKDGEVKDWKSWYQWRGLPLDSPVALLMDHPLSVYNLLVNVLKVVSPERSAENRQELTVHLIGADYELNIIPLFSELALLLPYVDLKLIFFGKPAYDLHYTGKLKTLPLLPPPTVQSGHTPLLNQQMAENWTRRALYRPLTEAEQEELDKVKRAAEQDPSKKDELERYQVEHEIEPQFGKLEMPNALIGLNAGLLHSQSWFEPMAISLVVDLPFAVTDATEQTLEHVLAGLPKIRSDCAQMCPEGTEQRDRLSKPWPPNYTPQTTQSAPTPPQSSSKPQSEAHTVPEPGSAAAIAVAAFLAPTLITVNPFHRPGRRQIPTSRLPNSNNGFCLLFNKPDNTSTLDDGDKADHEVAPGNKDLKEGEEGKEGTVPDPSDTISTVEKEDWIEVNVASESASGHVQPPSLMVEPRRPGQVHKPYVVVLSGVALCLAWFLVRRW
ncbi:hypothetical protein AX16_004932 [Volvariella volvacea WC 439]|nr:hypothetical protein AX16_004932 [Volvariella volvacea WC 439]